MIKNPAVFPTTMFGSMIGKKENGTNSKESVPF